MRSSDGALAAGFAIPLAITLAPLSEFAFVQAGAPQLFAYLLARRTLAHLTVTAAVALTSFAELAFVLAS